MPSHTLKCHFRLPSWLRCIRASRLPSLRNRTFFLRWAWMLHGGRGHPTVLQPSSTLTRKPWKTATRDRGLTPMATAFQIGLLDSSGLPLPTSASLQPPCCCEASSCRQAARGRPACTPPNLGGRRLSGSRTASKTAATLRLGGLRGILTTKVGLGMTDLKAALLPTSTSTSTAALLSVGWPTESSRTPSTFRYPRN